MPTTYYLRNTNADTTCDGSNTPLDLSTTQGSGPNSTGSSSINDTAYVECMSFDIDDGGNGSTGNHTISIDVSAIDTKCDARFRVQEISSGCSVLNSSAYSSAFSTTGIKTLGPTNLTWSTGNRLRLSIEIRRTSNGGNRSLSVNTEDADSTVIAPWSTAIVQSAGLASETDTVPGAASSLKEKAAGLSSETDTVPGAASPAKGAVAGLATETDTVPGAALWNPKIRIAGITTETDTSQTIAGSVKTKAAGLASSTDTVPGAASSLKTLAAGLSSETDTSLAASVLKTLAAGLASETDTAFSATASLGGGPPAGLRTMALTGAGV